MLEGLCGVYYLSGCDGLDLAIQTEQVRRGRRRGFAIARRSLWDFYQDLLWDCYRIRCSLVSSYLIRRFSPGRRREEIEF